MRSTRYNFLLASQKTLKAYGLNIKVVDAPALTVKQLIADSGVNLEGMHSDWSLEDCKKVDKSDWNEILAKLIA